jgi:hypothetical protein
MSGLEDAMATQIRMVGLPQPEREYKAIKGRKFRWDFAWPAFGLLAEIQGATWTKGAHSTGRGIQRDMEKLNLATLANWHTFQFSGDDVRSGRAIVILQKFFNNHQDQRKP